MSMLGNTGPTANSQTVLYLSLALWFVVLAFGAFHFFGYLIQSSSAEFEAKDPEPARVELTPTRAAFTQQTARECMFLSGAFE